MTDRIAFISSKLDGKRIIPKRCPSCDHLIGSGAMINAFEGQGPKERSWWCETCEKWYPLLA